MDDTKNAIKTSIEHTLKKYIGVDCIVEYCDDVAAKSDEINKQYNLSCFDNLGQIKGAFIPALEGLPAYIIINEMQPDHLYINTAFHELQHLLDMHFFLSTLHCNIEDLRNNPMYASFYVYSEYMAVKFGIENYLKNVSFPDMTNGELANNMASAYTRMYQQNLKHTKDRYHYSYYTMKYLAALYALCNFTDVVDFNSLTASISDVDFFEDLAKKCDESHKSENWYVSFDAALREYVG